jgi:hypothetical protein
MKKQILIEVIEGDKVDAAFRVSMPGTEPILVERIQTIAENISGWCEHLLRVVEPECEHVYSRSMNQSSPRLCIKCRRPER